MSRFCLVETIFKNEVALVSALIETGNWTKNQIDIHSTPQQLFGYKGDARQESAHIIIRRKHISSASNDIGFIKDTDGKYRAIISEYDSRCYNAAWLNRLKGNYAFHVIKNQQERLGRRVNRERLSSGKQRITVTGYR